MDDEKISSNSEVISENRRGSLFSFPIFSEYDCLSFTPESVSELESELELYEKTSLVFLLYNNALLALKEIEHLKENSSETIVSWCLKSDKSGKHWRFMFLESLALIQNYRVLKKLGCDKYDALKIFKPNDVYFTFAINPVKKILYTICESLTEDETENLLEKGKHFIGSHQMSCLEIYFLTLLSKNLLDINDGNKLSIIARCFRQIKRVDLANCIENMTEIINGHSNPVADISKATNSLSLNSMNQTRKKNDNCYKIINNDCVGLCIIINQQNFERNPTSQDPKLTNRDGSDVDLNKLMKIFKDLKFHVVVKEDLLQNDICPTIVQVVKDSFLDNRHSIFTLIILSHGIEGCVYGKDCRPVTINAIKNSLGNEYCPSLEGKPKVLIIQACQGKAFYDSSNIDADSNSVCDIAPRVSDLLVCVATVPGFKAFRHKLNGSWYIQALCKSLEDNRDEDIYSIITKVNHELLSKYYVYLSDANNCARRVSMLSEFTSCLSKSLYLRA